MENELSKKRTLLKMPLPTAEHMKWLGVAAADFEEELQRYVLQNAQPGQLLSSKGIYLGKWEPTSRDGVLIGKIFNVLAAPEDLPEKMPYEKIIEDVRNLKNWHGYDGADFVDDYDISYILETGIYNGGWVIPPYELLSGAKASLSETRTSAIIQLANFFDCKEKGAFRDSFLKASGSKNPDDYEGFYCSSTPDIDFDFCSRSMRLADGVSRSPRKFEPKHLLSCRPVRFVPVS